MLLSSSSASRRRSGPSDVAMVLVLRVRCRRKPCRRGDRLGALRRGGVGRCWASSPGDVLLSGATPASGYGLAECWLALTAGAVAWTERPSRTPHGSRTPSGLRCNGTPCSAWAWPRLCEAAGRGDRVQGPLQGPVPPALARDLAELPARAGLAPDGQARVWPVGRRWTPGQAPRRGAAVSPSPVDAGVVDAGLQPVARGLPGELLVEGPTWPRSDRAQRRTGQMLPGSSCRPPGPHGPRSRCAGARRARRGRARPGLHPAVAEAAAVPSDATGEARLVAWVVARPRPPTLARHLRSP